jgi:hypothetical protein
MGPPSGENPMGMSWHLGNSIISQKSIALAWAIVASVTAAGCQEKEATNIEDAHKTLPYIELMGKIQEKERMPELEVDRIMKGYPSSTGEIKGDHAVAAATFKGKTAFMKTYDCKLPRSKRHFLISVYFDDEHRVTGTSGMLTD